MTFRPRTILNAALFAFLIASSFRPFLVRLVLPPHRMPDVPGPLGGVDRKPLRLKGDPTPPDLRDFLAKAHEHVPSGATVAVELPPPFQEFSYEYWRAVYELAGRTVTLPLPGYSADAQYVVKWQPGGGTVTKR